MNFSLVWDKLDQLRTEELRAVVDAAESVACGSTDRTAERLAHDVLSIVRQTHPELVR
jgi:hypothetical protein